MNSVENFITIPYGGRKVRGVRIICSRCARGENVPVNTFKGHSDDRERQFIEAKLKRMSWKVGKSDSQHLCPGCFAKVRNAQDSKKFKEESSGMADSNIVKMPAARVMERDDRRIIFAKLDEIYDKDGYSADWTDAKVAIDLGVPRDWVKRIRDENFGPEGSNALIDSAIRDARALLAEAKTFGSAAERVINELRVLLGKAEKIERTVIEIERSLK
jgi:hypothetical protein